MNAPRFASAGSILALLSAPAWGQTNRALAFSAGDLVQVPASASIDSITNALTIEAWVILNAPGIYPTVMQRDLPGVPPGGNEVWTLRADSVGGQLTLAFYVRVGPDFLGLYNLFGLQVNVQVPLIEWHHLAGTFDGVTMRLFWDGVLMTSAVHPGGIAPTPEPVRIGTAIGSGTWLGQIDDVRLWNVARTSAEIQGYRYSPLTGNEPGLVGCWRFDEGTGQVAVDSTTNGNNGQLGTASTPDPNDPSWVTPGAPLGPFVLSVSPSFGPVYGSTPVTVVGQGFTPGASALSVGGQTIAGATVVDGGTITAVIPPGPAGPADISVSSLYGPGTRAGGWTWANHLHASPSGISTTLGGSSTLSLFAGPSNGLRLYLVATSLSGTSPGIALPGTSLVLPLNPDVWTEIGLQQLNSPTFASFLGILNSQGTSTASFNLGPIPITPAPIGLPIRFAYVVLPSFAGGFSLASNPVTVMLTP